ncbi:MAG: glycine cleavage T C-terminal barrel domain-containing protein [Chthoniobacterales bacterium]
MENFAVELERTVLEFRGADVVRFLNGQLSNDVRKLHSNIAMHACVMTAKGKMNAEVWLTKLDDGIRVDGPPNMSEELLARFERYIISDDVSITDISSELHLTHLVGESGGIQSKRLGVPGCDLWQTVKTTRSHRVLTPLETESFRIAQGIPKWGAELDENTIPVEAGLDRDCIDYHKGCYIGQEVISRIKSVGHVNRLLIRLTAPKDSAIGAGSPLLVHGQPIGSVTSAAVSLDLENIVALAYVKRAHSTPGTVIQTATGESLTVQSL